MADLPLFGEGKRLAELERERVEIMQKLAEVAQQQRALGLQMRRVERDVKAELRHVEEYSVPESQDLTLQDVEAWCRSAYFNLAHTMLDNPHAYFSRKKVRRPDMYQRVVRYVIDNGYPQRYGNSDYTVLDIEMNGTKWFCWPMTTEPSESQILNLKPASMKPSKDEQG